MKSTRCGGLAASFGRARERVSARWTAAAVGAAAVAAIAVSESRHAVLPVLAALGLLAAGGAFAMRWRITGNGSTGRVGLGLLTAGLHLPVGSIAADLLGAPTPSPVRAVAEAATLAAAALLCLGGLRPARRAVAPLAAAALGVGALGTVLVTGRAGDELLVAAHLGTAACWAVLAVTAGRRDRSTGVLRTSAGALAWVGGLVAVAMLVDCVPPLVPGLAPAATVGADLAVLAAAVVAAGYAVRRIADALEGQERYVAGLLEQLTTHERQLQQTRGCLHDARSAVAGIRATSSAVAHPLLVADLAERAALEQTIATELQRLERLLRLPARTPSLSSVHVDDLLRPVVVTHRERGLRVHWAPLGGGPVQLDGDALVVIVGNLVGNALVHAPGAECRITAEVGSDLVVTVADDGPGLDPAVRATAFEAGGCRPGSPGEGLGLAISRDLARRHGGDLVVLDEGPGTTFRLRLPVTVPAVVPAPRSPSMPSDEQVPARLVG